MNTRGPTLGMRVRRFARHLLAAVAVVAVSTPQLGSAAVPSDVTYQPTQGSIDVELAALMPSPERLAELAAEEEPVVDLLAHAGYELNSDGSVLERIRLVRMFLTPAGVARFASLSFVHDGWASRATIRSAFAVSPAGQRRSVPKSGLASEHVGSSSGFSDTVRTSVMYEGLAVGSVAVLEVDILARRARAGDGLPWSSLHVFAPSWPIERYVREVRWPRPALRPLWDSNIPGLREETLEEGKASGVRFSGAVPHGVKWPDTGQGFWPDNLPRFVVTTAESWPALAQGLEAVTSPRRQTSYQRKQLQELADKLTADKPDERAKLWALQHYVTHDVRYLSDDRGRYGTRARAPTQTMTRGYGDCKDKTALFLALARAVGIKARPVLVSTQRYRSDLMEIPAVAYFDHMVACMTLRDGVERCIDPTATTVGSMHLPVETMGRAAFDPLWPEGPAKLPALLYGYSSVREHTYRFEADGTYEMDLRSEHAGGFAEIQRAQFSSSTRAERDEQSLAGLEARYGKTTAHSVEFENLQPAADRVGPLVIRTKASVASTGPLEEFVRLSAPDAALEWVGENLGNASDEWWTQHGGARVQTRTVIEIPKGYEPFGLPATLDYEMSSYTLRRTVQQTGPRTVVAETLLELSPRDVPAEDGANSNREFETIVDEAMLIVEVVRQP